VWQVGGWGHDVARALSVLHSGEIGVVHADLELRNLFLRSDGRAVLGDFGASLFVGPEGIAGDLDTPIKADARAPTMPPELRRLYRPIDALHSEASAVWGTATDRWVEGETLISVQDAGVHNH
jgi:serine/threonine protein kinase